MVDIRYQGPPDSDINCKILQTLTPCNMPKRPIFATFADLNAFSSDVEWLPSAQELTNDCDAQMH